jgi:histidine triad (HIT) family protein
MENCVFCKIANGEISSAKVWEDKEFIAVLDIMPNTKGMTLVIPKKHYDSYVFDMPKSDYTALMVASKKVAGVLEKGLSVGRVALVMEGLGVNHAHIKLYPLHGVEKEFKEIWAKETVFFDAYDGYVSTQLGPKADITELEKLAEEIRRKNA